MAACFKRRLTLRFTVLILLSLIPIRNCCASDWAKYIRLLQNADAATKKKNLPRAYFGYAVEFWNKGEFKQAEKQLTRAISLASLNENRTLYRPKMAELLYHHAATVYGERKKSDHLHRDARKLAERSLRYNSKYAKAHILLGDIAYDNQDFQGAKVAWLRAQSIEPDNSSIRNKLKQAEQEKSVEKNFGRESLAFFDVRFQKGIASTSAVDLRRYLEVTRTAVGKDFRYFPKHKLVVLVYTKDGFQAIRKGRGQDWWAAYYDGKIRIPMPANTTDINRLKPTLAHEYTHAIVHDLSQGRCPRWMNEGLAEYQEAKIKKPNLTILNLATRLKRLIPLSELNDNLLASDHGRAALAYQQSYSLVTYIVERYGFDRVNRLLEMLAEGSDFEMATSKVLAKDLTLLEQDWVQWHTDAVPK